jgi:exonuclease III
VKIASLNVNSLRVRLKILLGKPSDHTPIIAEFDIS